MACIMLVFVSLQEELIRTKSGYFARESLSQLRMSINKSLVLSWDNNEDSEKETTYGDDVMELNKHVDKFYTYYDDDLRDSMLSTFASASCCEAESVSGDEICSKDVLVHKDYHIKLVFLKSQLCHNLQRSGVFGKAWLRIQSFKQVLGMLSKLALLCPRSL